MFSAHPRPSKLQSRWWDQRREGLAADGGDGCHDPTLPKLLLRNFGSRFAMFSRPLMQFVFGGQPRGAGVQHLAEHLPERIEKCHRVRIPLIALK